MSRPPAAVRRGGRTSCRAPAISAAHVTTDASKRRSEEARQVIVVMANTIVEEKEKASRDISRSDFLGIDFRRKRAMVEGSPPAIRGSENPCPVSQRRNATSRSPRRCRSRRSVRPSARSASRARSSSRARPRGCDREGACGRRRCHPYEIEIGVPSGSSFASSVMSGLASRMHPWLTAWPMLAGSSVPCSPIWPGPPPKLLNTSE